MEDQSRGDGSPQALKEERLESWKRIAAYLRRDVTTVQRWERREGMPVHRHLHDKQGSVFAYRSELDAWWASRPPPAAAADAGERRTPATDGGDAETVPVPSGRRRLAPLLLLITAVLVVAAGLAWLIFRAATAWHDPLADARYSRLPVSFLASSQAAAISPDGRLLGFLATRDGLVDAWVGAIGSGTYRNVTQGRFAELVNPSVRALGFSADSGLLSFWSRTADGTSPSDVSRYAAPVAGGAPAAYLPTAAEFAWSRDGRHVVYHTTAPGDPLFVSDGPGSAARRIYLATAGVHCHYPLWSPDGEYIYFVRGVPPDDWDLWRIRPSGAQLERITTHAARISYPVMLDRRTLLYLLTEPDGSGPWIYGLDVERRVPHRLSPGFETYTSLSASADGRRLVASLSTPRTSLWRIALLVDAAGRVSAGAPTVLLTDAGVPRLGPGFLLFVSQRGGSQGLWTSVNGTARQIWSEPRARVLGAPAIARDGRIAFAAQSGSGTRLLVMERDGSHLRVLADSLELRGSPAWAPDNQSLIVAAVQDGQPRLVRVLLNGAAPQPFVSEYSVDPVWSPDGRFVIYAGADVGTTFPLRAAAADGRAYALPGVMLTRGARAGFFADGERLVVTRGEIDHKNLWLLDLRSVTEHELLHLPSDFVIGEFDVAADGSELIVERREDDADLALIERP